MYRLFDDLRFRTTVGVHGRAMSFIRDAMKRLIHELPPNANLLGHPHPGLSRCTPGAGRELNLGSARALPAFSVASVTRSRELVYSANAYPVAQNKPRHPVGVIDAAEGVV